MKTFSLKAIAAAALIICGLSVYSPACAETKTTSVSLTVGDGHDEDTATVDSMSLEKLRMQYEHEEAMKAMDPAFTPNPLLGDAPIFFFLTYFFCIGVPTFAILWGVIVFARKRREREKEANNMIMELSKNGQTLTPELVEALKAKAKTPGKDSDLSKTDLSYGLTKTFEGVALLLMAFVIYIFIGSYGAWLCVPGFFLLAQGVARLLTIKMNKKSAEAKDENGTL